MDRQSDLSSLYDEDFFEWTRRSADLLRKNCFAQADIDHVAEEIEDMGKRDQHETASQMTTLLMHLLKWQFQPPLRYTESGSSSWLSTIAEQRQQLTRVFQQSPSLRRYAREILEEVYPDAIVRAAAETGLAERAFPAECPYTFDQIMNREFLPESDTTA
jgi:Domain of unknown function DUF29